MNKITLWCSPVQAPPTGCFIIYWAQYLSEQDRREGHLSLPEMINADADYWKTRYLSWLDTIGKSPCGTTTVVDSLLIRPGLSYWWMTIPSDFSFSPTCIAYATLRLWALAQILEVNNVEELEVNGAEAALKEILATWCKRTGRQISFTDGRIKKKDESQNETVSSRMKKRLPSIVKGIGFLTRQYLRYLTRNRHRNLRETTDVPALTIVDYFASFDVNATREATYASNYWGPLDLVITQLGLTVNWIHIEVATAALPDVRSARTAIRGLNGVNNYHRHVLLQDYLSLRVVFHAVAQYLRIRRFTNQLVNQIPWVETDSGIDISPLVLPISTSDYQGIGAADRALWISLFEEALSPEQAQGACLYLMENQPWELALLHAQTRWGGGPNIGVAHATVRPWDFRYALGSTGFTAGNRQQTLPAPSLVAVIDPSSETVMISNGLSPYEIVNVEALRFLSLNSTARNVTGEPTSAHSGERVLVIGEYDPILCSKQLQILEELVLLAGEKFAFTFRPHPAKPILLENIPEGVLLSRAQMVEEDFTACDLVLCSNVSSASLTANLMGLPILMFRDGSVFNGSPLKPGSLVTFVKESSEVIAALKNFELSGQLNSSHLKYPMYLDRGLAKWRALLNSL